MHVTERNPKKYNVRTRLLDLVNALVTEPKIVYHIRTIVFDPMRDSDITGLINSDRRHMDNISELVRCKKLDWLPDIAQPIPTSICTMLLFYAPSMKSLNISPNFINAKPFQDALTITLNPMPTNPFLESSFSSICKLDLAHDAHNFIDVPVQNLLGFPALVELSIKGAIIVRGSSLADNPRLSTGFQPHCRWLEKLLCLKVQGGHIDGEAFNFLLGQCSNLKRIRFVGRGRWYRGATPYEARTLHSYSEALCGTATRSSLRSLSLIMDLLMADLNLSKLENVKELALAFYSYEDESKTASQLRSILPRSLRLLEIRPPNDWLCPLEDINLPEKLLYNFDLAAFEHLRAIDLAPAGRHTFLENGRLDETDASSISQFCHRLWGVGISLCPVYYSPFRPRLDGNASEAPYLSGERSDTMWHFFKICNRIQAKGARTMTTPCLLRWRKHIFRIERQHCCDFPGSPDRRVIGSNIELANEIQRLRKLPEDDPHSLGSVDDAVLDEILLS